MDLWILEVLLQLKPVSSLKFISIYNNMDRGMLRTYE